MLCLSPISQWVWKPAQPCYWCWLSGHHFSQVSSWGSSPRLWISVLVLPAQRVSNILSYLFILIADPPKLLSWLLKHHLPWPCCIKPCPPHILHNATGKIQRIAFMCDLCLVVIQTTHDIITNNSNSNIMVNIIIMFKSNYIVHTTTHESLRKIYTQFSFIKIIQNWLD